MQELCHRWHSCLYIWISVNVRLMCGDVCLFRHSPPFQTEKHDVIITSHREDGSRHVSGGAWAQQSRKREGASRKSVEAERRAGVAETIEQERERSTEQEVVERERCGQQAELATYSPSSSCLFNKRKVVKTQLIQCEQVAQLSQRNRAAGWVSFGQKWKTGTRRQYFSDIISLSLTTVTWSACKSIEFGEKNAK